MRIALIGDSQGQGLWPHLSKALSAAGHTIVLQRAQPGWGIPSYKKEGKIGQQLQEAAPNLVVFSLGGNNYEFSPSKYGAQVQWALSLLPPGTEYLWLGPAHATRADVATRHDKTAAMEPGLIGSRWMDSNPYTQTGHADGVHFKSSVYKSWAGNIAARIIGSGSVSPAVTSSLPVLIPAQAAQLSHTSPPTWVKWTAAGLGVAALVLLIKRAGE